MIRLSKIYAAFGAAAIAAFSAGSAQAFTIQDGSGSTGGASALAPSPFNTPQKKVDVDKNGMSSMQFGDSTIHFGTQDSPEAGYNRGLNNMFNPLGRPGN